jgi:hypothetical protein
MMMMMISNNKLKEKHSSTCAPFNFLLIFVWRFRSCIQKVDEWARSLSAQFIARRHAAT